MHQNGHGKGKRIQRWSDSLHFDEFVLLSFGILTCMNHSEQEQKHALTSVDFMMQLMQDIWKIYMYISTTE